MQLLNRHARKFGEQDRGQEPVPRLILLNAIGQLDDQFAQQRRDRQRAAAIRQIGSARLDVDEENPRIGRRDVAVFHTAGNPHPAMRRHHPQAAGDAAGDATAECEDELALAVPMGSHFRFGFGDVDAHRNCRRDGVIHIEIDPGVA